MPTGLDAPTQFPGQPVTAGADAGPGPTSQDIGLNQQQNVVLRERFGMVLPTLIRMADSAYATPEYRRQVRSLIARIQS
jgi:hypothetical protein